MYKYKTFYLTEELIQYLNNKCIDKENIIYLKKEKGFYTLIYKEK